MSRNSGHTANIVTKLSRQGILDEPPGPQLDRWVAKYVFVRRQNWQTEDVPRFSIDIACAWPLLEDLLKEAGGCFTTYQELWMCRIGDSEEVTAATAPEAICKAGLLECLQLWSRDIAGSRSF